MFFEVVFGKSCLVKKKPPRPLAADPELGNGMKMIRKSSQHSQLRARLPAAACPCVRFKDNPSPDCIHNAIKMRCLSCLVCLVVWL
jgi:hypothetical protein